MAYSIIVHSPDKARIPFTVSSGSITLEDVPALIKKLLTREKHPITSDLILQQDVSLTEHSFLVVRESQRRYHVFAVPGRYSSYEAVGNQARQLYAGVFNNDFDWNRVNLCSCDKEIHSQEDRSNFGTFFLLGSQEPPPIETKLPPLQSHLTREKTISNRSIGANEHLPSELNAREGKEGHFSGIELPQLIAGGEYKSFIQTSNEKDGGYSKTTGSEVLSESEARKAVMKESNEERVACDLRQVQLLEHVYNGSCADKGVCEDEHVTPSFIQDLEKMRLKVQERQNLPSLIPYIAIHAARCPGGTCAVPDCSTQNRILPQSVRIPSSNHLSIPPQTDSIGWRHRQEAVCDTSFDIEPAFYSSSPEEPNVKQYQHGIAQARTNLPVFHHNWKDSQLRLLIEQEGRNGTGATVTHGFQTGTSIPDVEQHGFQNISVYNCQTGTCIFSREDSLKVGLTYPLPEGSKRLGKGGNGRVTAHVINNKLFAVKKTLYRSMELNSWIKLNHTNLIPLLAVLIDPIKKECYQFMPIMKGSLKLILNSENLEQLSRSVSENDWKLISGNLFFILKNVLKALSTLEKLNIQHCDVKADNVLIGECSCRKGLYCSCEESGKFQVYLADFDSMNETLLPRKPSAFPPTEFVSRNATDKIMGTPGYRAPEIFKKPKRHNRMYGKTIMDGHIKVREEQNCSGPWCDIWSFGVMTARVCIGKPDNFINDANCLLRNFSAPEKVTPYNENIHAFVTLYQLIVAALEDENMKPFARLAKRCLELRYNERPNADELLDFIDTELLCH